MVNVSKYGTPGRDGDGDGIFNEDGSSSGLPQTKDYSRAELSALEKNGFATTARLPKDQRGALVAYSLGSTDVLLAKRLGLDLKTEIPSSSSFKINAALREGTFGKEKYAWAKQANKDLVKGLDAHIAKSSLPDNMNLYRGIVVGADFDAKSFEGKTMQVPAYTSTSASRSVAEGFANRSRMQYGQLKEGEKQVVMTIRAAKGSKAAYVPVFERKNNNSEFVLPRGAQIKIHAVKEDDKGVIHMEASYGF